MIPFLATFDDVLYAADTYVRFSEKPSMNASDTRFCVESALREIVSAAEWNCMKKVWRVQLKAMQTGTLTYLGTSGTTDGLANTSTVDREIFLKTGDSFPSWATDGEIKLSSWTVNSVIDNVINAGPSGIPRAQLDANLYPAQDFASAVSYLLGLAKYPLPPEFAAGITAADRNAWFVGVYVPWEQWVLLDKYRVFSGIVRNYTIGPDPKRYGQQAIYVHPMPSVASEYDLGIKNWRRPMNLSGREPWQNVGTVRVESGSAVVQGTGTAFDQRMVGSVFRCSGTSALPTGTAGTNPYLFQQTIASVASATSLTLSLVAPSLPSGAPTLSSAGYCVSDPCDVPIGLFDAFKEAVYAQLARFCNPKEYAVAQARYATALRLAKAADNPNRTTMGVGTGVTTISRLRDNASRPTVGGAPGAF